MDIEHISPKSKNPHLATDWNNLLIACKICNRIKSNKNENRDGYIFPDIHNTAYAYNYTQSKVLINEKLTDDEKKLAQATLDLVDINRKKDSNNRKDDRFFARIREWDKAKDSLDDYHKNNSNEMKRQIARSASCFISSWLTIFKDYKEVKEEILKNSIGTNINYYDDDFNPIERII